MIEKTVLDYLAGQLTGIPVYMEVPVNKPAKFVVIEKTGSSEENYVYRATIAVQSYANSLFNAANLNESIIELMDDIPDEAEEVSACELNSDYNYTDPETKQYRYQAVFDLIYLKE